MLIAFGSESTGDLKDNVGKWFGGSIFFGAIGAGLLAACLPGVTRREAPKA